MAFSAGDGSRAIRPIMNVTPLVDVVLVLLIIFMVVTPLLTRQFGLQLPVEDESPGHAGVEARPPVVLSMNDDGTLAINRERVSDGELDTRLERVLSARPDRTLFFAAQDAVPYGRTVEVMDRARQAGALTIAVLTEAP